MPIYEYHCSKCGDFETMQKISDKPLSKCPTCGGKVRKLISSTSFQLKGSGWYITDYARKGDGSTSKSDDKKSSDKKSTDASSDSAAKTETTSTTESSPPKSEKSSKKGSKKASAA